MTTANSSDADAFPISDVNRLKRMSDRGHYDKKTVYGILDAALVCGGGPFPMSPDTARAGGR